MVYIRFKKVKSEQYLYLVKSVWDSKKKTSKQEIIKYLGKASLVVKDDIPIEFRNDAKILSVLASYNPQDIQKREDANTDRILASFLNSIGMSSFTTSDAFPRYFMISC